MLGIDRQHGGFEKLSLEEIRAFLESSGEVRFQARKPGGRVLGWQDYGRLKRSELLQAILLDDDG